jgi:N-acetylmuramoyl-L-alanine amidase
MKKGYVIIISFLFTLALVISFKFFFPKTDPISGAPPYGELEKNVPDSGSYWLNNWERPYGPVKVALQVGHWKNDDLPQELKKLRSSDGATGGGKSEWQVNLAIAGEVKSLLEKQGVEVEILPATVPPAYWTDVFLSIHADGSEDSSKRGFKIAPPWRDFTRNADDLASILYDSYSKATGFPTDENVTRNMRGYYAFSWWRYKHAIHPMTTAAIVETGFLTNPADQKLLVNTPQVPAEGIAEGIIKYLSNKDLLEL